MRARNLKPSLFKNELLGSADPLYTLVFEGLWCLADRDGRLEDRPLRIHAEVNPYRDSAGTVQALCWLVQHGFVIRYESEGTRCLQIANFRRHQQPHVREPASKLPAPTNQQVVAAQCQPGAEHQPGTSPARLNPPSPFPLPEGEDHSAAAAAPSPPPKAAQGPNRKRRGPLGHFVPEDWTVPEDDYRWALAQGYPPDFIARETERFCDHEFAKPRSDWTRAWRNWITRDPPKGGRHGQTFRVA